MTLEEIIDELKESDEFFNNPSSEQFLLHSRYDLSELTSKDRRTRVKIDRYLYSTLRYIEGGTLESVGEEVDRDHATVLNSIRYVHTNYFYDTQIKDRIYRHLKDHQDKNIIQKNIPCALIRMAQFLNNQIQLS